MSTLPRRKFLIIQTAFIGDVILATAVAEKLHVAFPGAAIDFLLRKGNESLLAGHPFIRHVLIWDKKKDKVRNLIRVIARVRSEQYSTVINVHRFASSGLITAMSGASQTIGFDKNPLSFLFSRRVRHVIEEGVHETDRNQSLIAALTDSRPAAPALYPQDADRQKIQTLVKSAGRYVCIAPASVWFTKQFPTEKWRELIDDPRFEADTVYLLGAESDLGLCAGLAEGGGRKIVSLAGQLSFLESAALMQRAEMNYVNDSAPLHLASSVDAPVAAVFCSTVPGFGFGPLSHRRSTIQIEEKLYCRPCGLHGFKSCPEGHFKCARMITIEQLLRAREA